LIIKFKVEDTEEEKGYKKKKPLLVEGKILHEINLGSKGLRNYEFSEHPIPQLAILNFLFFL